MADFIASFSPIKQQVIKAPPEPKPEPIIEPAPAPAPRDEWDELIDKFMLIYPEFVPLLNTGNAEKDAQNKAFIKVIFEKIRCLYPEFSELDKCKQSLPYLMLVAHYLTMSGRASDLGITGASGIMANSSVGDVSVGYQPAPYSGADTDEFRYWLSLSPYGKEYLAWLARQSGLLYVNNY